MVRWHCVRALAVASALATACALHTSADDGQSCQGDSDCKSGHCVHGTCLGSTCSCSGSCSQTGSPSGDCASGWMCVYVPPDAVTGFFGASGGNHCEPGCSACPTHWACVGGSSLCTYDASWSAPQVTISGPSTGQTGQTLTFVANATSPDGAGIESYGWTFDTFHGMSASASNTASYAYPSPGQYTVTAYVADSNGQTGQATLMVTICGASGVTCNGPKDCCNPLSCQIDTSGNGSCH